MAVCGKCGYELKSGAKSSAKAGSPIQPSPRLVRVIPSCVAERYSSIWDTITWARRARLLPWRIISSILVARTLTMENSAATKNPFKMTSAMAAAIRRSWVEGWSMAEDCTARTRPRAFEPIDRK